MLIYYFSFFLPLLPMLFKNRIIFYNLIFFNLFFFIVFVGLRHEIGGDWCAYKNQLAVSSFIFFKAEAAYYYIFFLSGKLGLGVHGINLVIAIIFILSLHTYIKTLPYYSLGFAVSVPHLIIILAMGFSQQALAFSFCLLGINALRQGKLLLFIFFVLFASLFHLSSLIMICLYVAAFEKTKYFVIYSSIILLFILSYILIDFDPIIYMYHYYLGEGMHQRSRGAVFRVGLSVFFAVIYLVFIRKRINNIYEKRIYTILSLFAFILFTAIFFGGTVLADRLNYYIWPLQLFTITQSVALGRTKTTKFMLGLTLVILYCSLLSIWLFFGSAVKGWLPYRMYPLDTVESCLIVLFSSTARV